MKQICFGEKRKEEVLRACIEEMRKIFNRVRDSTVKMKRFLTDRMKGDNQEGPNGGGGNDDNDDDDFNGGGGGGKGGFQKKKYPGDKQNSIEEKKGEGKPNYYGQPPNPII